MGRYMINVEYNFNQDGTYSGVPAQNPVPKKPKDRTWLMASAAVIGVIALAVMCMACGYLGAMYLIEQQGGYRDAVPGSIPSPVVTATPSPITQTDKPSSSPTVTPVTGEQMTVDQVVANCVDSVVMVHTEAKVTGSWNQSYVTSGAGSGVILSPEGIIITNHHVIDGADTIKVTLTDGTTYDATLIASDEPADVAVIRIMPGDKELTVAVAGKTGDVQLGETVVAIGNPMGLGSTVTDGIVSALSREIVVNGISMTLMQTNAEINPGNSGGGLFNAYGQLIGIVNAKASDTEIEGIGFAIPIDYAVSVANQLMEQGYVSGRATMDVDFIDINDYFTAMQHQVDRYGVYVFSAWEDSQLKVGDYIISIDDKEIKKSSDILSLMLSYNVGDVVKVKIIRDGVTMTIDFTLVEYKPES